MNMIMTLPIRELVMLALIAIETVVILCHVIRKAARQKKRRLMLEALRTPEAKKALFEDIQRQTARLHV